MSLSHVVGEESILVQVEDASLIKEAIASINVTKKNSNNSSLRTESGKNSLDVRKKNLGTHATRTKQLICN